MRSSQGGTRATARRALKLMVLAICATLGIAAASGTALAKQTAKKPTTPKITVHTPVTPGAGYLALGDSVSFGYEEARSFRRPTTRTPSSFLGYPEMLGSELHLKVANAACPGETSSSLINATAQSNGCENTPSMANVGYRTLFPLHVKYSGSQLAYAVVVPEEAQKVRLVSLMIGANDCFVCQETTADKCASLSEQAGDRARSAKNVKTILSTIRNKAHYGGQIAIVNYYSLDYASPAGNAQIELQPDRRHGGEAVPRGDRGRLRRSSRRRPCIRRQHMHGRAAHAAVDRRLRDPSELRRTGAPGAQAVEKAIKLS